MAHSLARYLKLLAYPIAGALIFGMAGTAYAQSRTATVSSGAAASTAAAQKRQTTSSIATGRTAQSRHVTAAAAAPLALALENAGPGPSSTPEPMTLALVGGALAGLYGMRKHLS